MLLKPFETFLTEHFLKESNNTIQSGYRYQFQSPDTANSKKLYQSFIEHSTESINVKSIDLPIVKINDKNLIPVLHNENGEGFSENFISHLRDEVAGQQGQLKNSALLIIHNSMLDTLINSAEDVAEINGIWNPSTIKESMKSLINYHDNSHQVSECLLEHRFNQILDDGATMFGFVELYKALLDGDLQFIELGLLNDPAILKWDGKQEQINERLDKNKNLFEKLERITHHFPNQLEEKLAEINLSEKFVNKNFCGDNPDKWRTELELSAIFQEQKNNLSNLLELEKESTSEGELISKSKAESKAGQRDRHMILLLKPDQMSFSIEFTFIGGKIERKQCTIQHNKTDIISIRNPDNTGGKRSRVEVYSEYNGQPLYFTFNLKREKTSECYKFRVLVLKKDEFHIDSFQHNFIVEPNKNRLTIQTEDNSFIISEQGTKAVVDEIGQVFEKEHIGEIDFEQLANESDSLYFKVKSSHSELTFNVEGAIATGSISLPLLLDKDRFVRLYKDDFFGTYNQSKDKIVLDNKEITPKGRKLTLLRWECELLNFKILTRKDDQTANIYLDSLGSEYPALFNAYTDLFDYFSTINSLPSISGWGEKLREIVNSLIAIYLKEIEAIKYDALLTKAQKQLVNIGFATFEGEEYLTPFHPLNLAYYLNLVNQITSDSADSFKTLPPVTIDRLNAQGLMPFVYHPTHEFSYNQLEKENCMWLKLVPQRETSYSYIRKLVKEKVTEFKDAFSALFMVGEKSTLIINSVNNQKNNELFLGLVDYVKRQKDKVCHIHVNLYDEELDYTEFDKFAETASYDEIKTQYELHKGPSREQADTIIDLLRTRLTYSKFKNSKVEEQAYAHLSFFRNNNKVESVDVNVDEELSGIVCNGLLVGEAAATKQESYFTGFGLKNVVIDEFPHLRIAKRLGSLIKPSRKSNEQYSRSKSLALAVSDNFRALLERSYNSSTWTTIIDPKVTLDFFNNANDLVLIHYSDNYTNSVNYDAITVSKETTLYKKVLEQDEGGITEEFNAFNGEWLLKMITANDNDKKEKRGIIGAYKFVNCLLSQSDITWIPLSVAEMIRVAGNIGLKMTDSDFSRHVQGYKSGLISDDVLFVGFKNKQMYLLPLEVKAGIKQTHNKGVQQAKELKRYLTEEILGRQDFAGSLYRGLFIRQIFMQVDKYKLYNIYEANYFNDFIDQREWWLQGDYCIAEIINYPEGFLVSHVENNTFFEAEFTEVENILKIQLPSSYLKGFITTPLQELMYDVCPEKLCHIPQKYILPKTTTSTSGTKTALNNNFYPPKTGNISELSIKESNSVDSLKGLTSVQPSDSVEIITINTLIKNIVIPENCQKIVKRIAYFSKDEPTVNMIINTPCDKFHWITSIKKLHVEAFENFKEDLTKAINSISQSSKIKMKVSKSTPTTDNENEQQIASKTLLNSNFSPSKNDEVTELKSKKSNGVDDFVGLTSIQPSDSVEIITINTLIKNIVIPENCQKIVKRIAYFYKDEPTVNTIINTPCDKFHWIPSIKKLHVEAFEDFKEDLTKAINSISQSSKIKMIVSKSTPTTDNENEQQIASKTLLNSNFSHSKNDEVTKLKSKKSNGVDDFVGLTSFGPKGSMETITSNTFTKDTLVPDKCKNIIRILEILTKGNLTVNTVINTPVENFFGNPSISQSNIKSFQDFKRDLSKAINSLGQSKNKDADVPATKKNQPLASKTIEVTKPSDMCIGDWEDILEFTGKQNSNDIYKQTDLIKFQLRKFYVVRELAVDGYHSEVSKIKEHADWYHPGDYESQQRYVTDEINKLTNPTITLSKTDNIEGSEVESLKPKFITNAEWVRITSYANEQENQNKISKLQTVKNQIKFYLQIKDIEFSDFQKSEVHFESLLSEAKHHHLSDYEKQYEFIKRELDNRDFIITKPETSQGLPKDVTKQIYDAANIAYFDDKEMFNVFIKEQTDAYIELKKTKPIFMRQWEWDTLVDLTGEEYYEDYYLQLLEVKKQLLAFNKVESFFIEGMTKEVNDTKANARIQSPADYIAQMKHLEAELQTLQAISEEEMKQKHASKELENFDFSKISNDREEQIMDYTCNLFPDDKIAQLSEVKNQIEIYLKTLETQTNNPPDDLKEIEFDSELSSPKNIERHLTSKPKLQASNLKILIGNNVQNDAEVLWEPTNTAKFMNTNSGIIGTMGTGKTQCTKSVVTQLYRNQHSNVDGKPIGILIFDYKSDYVDDKFIDVTQGKKFNLHKLPYNPLSLFGDTPMLPVHTARGFSETMGKAFGLGQKQTLKLRKLIGEAYDLAGIKKAEPSTWHKPAPTIADVWALFEESEPTEDSLYAALESLYELEIFETDVTKCTSLYELVEGITVVELAGYPGEIQNLVVALTLDLFHSQMQKQGKPEVQGDFRQVTKLLLVDEADNFMSQNFPSLRKILKEGREYGVGVILSTQDITHFKTSENDYSAYILSWIVHRVGQIKNQDIKSIFNKDDKADQDQLMKSIRELDKHYSLYVDGDKKVQKIKDKAFWELLDDA